MKLRVFVFFLVLLSVALPLSAQEMTYEYTVNVGGNEELGSFLVGPTGMTLYTFDRDVPNQSNCAGKCLENWPALTVESADALTVDPAIAGEFATITRDDGTLQVIYNDRPLYYWVRDEAVGDATGNYVGRVWWVATPATLYVAGNPDLGHFLVGSAGMTLYIFKNDTEGVSNCSGTCLENWPALTVASEEDLLAGAGVVGELGIITRDDGALQVTYNGMPLYYFKNDAVRGDATGQGAGDVWFVAVSETVITAESETLGTFLTDAHGLTLYTFKNDTAGVSNCSGECATAWPPLLVGEHDQLVGGAGVEGELGTITREDGVLQVTYNGMPLYYWKDDFLPGDTLGQGFGDVWFVAAP